RHRENEERRIVLRRAAALADLDRAMDDACAVLRQRGDDRRRAFASQLALADVERPALGAEHEEAIESRPVIDRPGVAPSGIWDLCSIMDRLALRRGHQP